MNTTWFPANTPATVRLLVVELREHLAAAEIDFQLWAGGEVRLSNKLLPWFKEHGIPTLGPGRCVLVDWWGNDWPHSCVAACEFLIAEGYQPILAHPERMGLIEEELEEAIAGLESLGVWLQGNLNSISGGEGPGPETRGKSYLQADRYFVLASDTHDPMSTPSRVSGLDTVRQLRGDATLDMLLAKRTREVLLHRSA